jgi:hypothetical protein
VQTLSIATLFVGFISLLLGLEKCFSVFFGFGFAFAAALAWFIELLNHLCKALSDALVNGSINPLLQFTRHSAFAFTFALPLPLPLPLPFLFPYAGMATRNAMEGESSRICGAGVVHHHKCIA